MLSDKVRLSPFLISYTALLFFFFYSLEEIEAKIINEQGLEMYMLISAVTGRGG